MKKLGFGLMRLPVLNGNQEEIDLEQVKEMADRRRVFEQRHFFFE